MNDEPDNSLDDDDEDGPSDAEAEINEVDAGSHFLHYMENSAHVPSRIDGHPTTDALNNNYIRVIHTNGVHHIALLNCACQGNTQIIKDLMYAGFLPTSFKRVRTVFTTAVLDLFCYSNLELNASAYQFFQLLRRMTKPLAPAEVINFYHELRRLSRMWRWMKKLKWAGFGHKYADPMKPAPGELAVFCPACLQAGVNLPDDWLQDPNR